MKVSQRKIEVNNASNSGFVRILEEIKMSNNMKKNEEVSRKRVVSDVLRRSSKKKVSPIYRIPKEKLEQAIEKIKEPAEMQIEKGGCYGSISSRKTTRGETKKMSFKRLLMEARICLVDRDWRNLSLLLTFAKPVEHLDYQFYFSTFIKYALCCLMVDPKIRSNGYMDPFLTKVLGLGNEAERRKLLSSFNPKLH